MIKYAIFDMDGTLVDSMGFWKDLAREYLTKHNVEYYEGITKNLLTMTLTQSGVYFANELKVNDTPDNIVNEMNEMMMNHYKNDVPVKENMAKFLDHLKNSGIKCCIATATNPILAKECLQRLKIYDYFDFLLSTETRNISKLEPDIFLECCEKFGGKPEETVVFEDALFAMETAKKAGFKVVGIYDNTEETFWKKAQTICDKTYMKWQDAIDSFDL